MLDFHKWAISASVLGVNPGRYGDESASLVVFEFRFYVDAGKKSRYRLAYANITTTFEPTRATGGKIQRPPIATNNTNNNKSPNVKLFNPKIINGPVTTVEQTDGTGESSVRIGPLPSLPIVPQLGIKTKTTTERYIVDSMFVVNRKFYPSRR